MKITRRSLSVLMMTIVLIIFIQLIRMGLVLNLNTTANTLEYVYRPEQAQSLDGTEKGACVKPGCLVICPEDHQEELANIAAVLDSLQFRQDTMAAGDHRADYRDYDLILILGQRDGQLADLDRIVEYVRSGGHLIYLGNGQLGRQDMLVARAALFGIESWDETRAVTRLDFRTEILSGLTGGVTFGGNGGLPESLFSSLQVKLAADCLVHITGDQSNPVLWQRNGPEKIMVINTGSYANKRFRGLLAGALSVFLDTVIYPVARSAVWQIVNIPVDEDYEPEVLKANYSRNFKQYILDIWWRDMVALMKKYSLKFTVAYLGSFDDNVDGPFNTRRLSETDLNTLSQAIIKSKGEISFQGYNHHPLLLTRTEKMPPTAIVWPDAARMSEAIQCSVDFLRTLLPNYRIYTYVPPDNQLTEQAIGVLRQRLPELKIISGIYFDPPGPEDNPNEPLFIQDFSVSESYGAAFPQVTASCFLNDKTRFDMASVATVQGIISHVIEADEILRSAQNRGTLWEDLSREYDLLFEQAARLYGWMNHDTVTPAVEKLKQMKNLDLFYESSGQTIRIACGNFDSPTNLILVSRKTITGGQGCNFQKIDSIRYLVTLHEKTATLEVGAE